MKNNGEMEGPKYKKKLKKKRKEKIQGKDVWHVGKREEASSLLKYD